VTGLLAGNTNSGPSVRHHSSVLLSCRRMTRLASGATIIGMPLTTLAARNDLITVNTLPSCFTWLDWSPDRCMDLPRRFLDLHGDQPALHFHSRPLSCLPSSRQSRGRRSRRRRSPCHLLRAQRQFFLLPSYWSIPTFMIVRTNCVSFSCSNPATRTRY
jgi:hypothetical protein